MFAQGFGSVELYVNSIMALLSVPSPGKYAVLCVAGCSGEGSEAGLGWAAPCPPRPLGPFQGCAGSPGRQRGSLQPCCCPAQVCGSILSPGMQQGTFPSAPQGMPPPHSQESFWGFTEIMMTLQNASSGSECPSILCCTVFLCRRRSTFIRVILDSMFHEFMTWFALDVRCLKRRISLLGLAPLPLCL